MTATITRIRGDAVHNGHRVEYGFPLDRFDAARSAVAAMSLDQIAQMVDPDGPDVELRAMQAWLTRNPA